MNTPYVFVCQQNWEKMAYAKCKYLEIDWISGAAECVCHVTLNIYWPINNWANRVAK